MARKQQNWQDCKVPQRWHDKTPQLSAMIQTMESLPESIREIVVRSISARVEKDVKLEFVLKSIGHERALA